MGRRRRFSPTLTSTLVLVIISISTLLQVGTCCKPQTQNSNNDVDAVVRLKKRGVLLTTILLPSSTTLKPPKAKHSGSPNGTSKVAAAAAADGRPKRQLFRGDIPHHRPLTGSTFAVYNTNRWLPSASPVEVESRGLESVVPSNGPVYIPNVDAISEVPPPKHLGHDQPTSYQVIHSNEIVHAYPVEVSPVISLHSQPGHHHHAPPPPPRPQGRGYAHPAHAPPKVHPDQDPERLRLIGKSNPDAPADLVIKELNGESGPTGELVKIINGGNSNEHEYDHSSSSGYEEGNNNGASFESYGSDFEYRGKPVTYYGPPYQNGAQKLAHFLKHWPWLLKSKLFPARYHRKRAPYFG